MRVVYLVTQTNGGLLHYTAQLANSVSKYADVTVIGPQKLPNNYFSKNIKMVNVFDCPIGKNIIKSLSFKNVNCVDKIKPDIIHITIPHIIMLIFSFIYRQEKKYPMVLTKHDPKPHVGKYLSEAMADVINGLIKYERIIVHSEKHKDILIKRDFISEKIVAVPHGDYSFFVNYEKKSEVEKNTILFFGHIRKYKGLEYLIKAVPLISKEISNLKVIIAGDGDFSRYSKLITDNSKFKIWPLFPLSLSTDIL